MEHEPKEYDKSQGSESPQARGRQQAWPPGADSNHNEDNFNAFEHGDLKGAGECDTIPAVLVIQARQGCLAAGKGGLLIVEGNLSGRSQNSLAEPPQTKEQKQYAHKELKRMKRKMRQGPAKHNDHRQEQCDRSGCPAERSAPAAHGANSQNDRQGFHALDERCKKTCKKGRTGMGPVDHHRGRLAEPEGRQPQGVRRDSREDTVSWRCPCSEIRACMHHALVVGHSPVAATTG